MDKIESILRARINQTTIEDIVIPMNAYNSLLSIQNSGTNPGYSLCVGFEESMASHVSYMDVDIYAAKDYNIKDPNYLSHILESEKLDGAILIGKYGRIKHSGMYYEHSPSVTLQQMDIYTPKTPLWIQYGFSVPVCTRHLTAINGSYHMPTTFIFVLSQEHSQIRVFHRGKIIYSPVDTEING